MEETLIPIALVLVGVMLIVLETFIPSAGVLGVLAGLALLSGIVCAFYFGGLTIGTCFMIATVAGVGLLIAYMVRKWPQTPLGKLILIEPPPARELLPDRSEIQSLVGRVGKSLAVMLPSGLVEIDGKAYDATARSTIEKNTWVKVLAINDGRILVVQPVDEEVALRTNTGEPDPDPGPDISDPFDDALG